MFPLVLLLAATLTRADCVPCHEDAVKSFTDGSHGRLMAAKLDQSCVACHAPTAEHIESPSTTNVTRIPTADACLSCHPAARAQLMRASDGHRSDRVACTDCHAPGHVTAFAPHMLKAPAVDVCGSCHAVQRSSFSRPFAHREGKEAFACTECHSPHGVRRTERLSDMQRSGACVECHSELAGPKVFEHAGALAGGCVACHEPHGSTNSRLLKRNDVMALCLECHADVPRFHDVTQSKYRACTSCHVAVHGSNRDARLFDE